jgi:hypothetical protein
MARKLLRSDDTEFRIVDEPLGERAVGLRIEIVTSDGERDDELGLNFGALRICDEAE